MTSSRRGAEIPRRLPGEEGVWVFIVGDMLVFALFFGVIVSVHADDPGLFRRSQDELSLTAGTVNTLVLLTSSLLVALGMQAARRVPRGRAAAYFAGALLCGLTFVAVKVLEYAATAGTGMDPAANDFWMYYFVFTGIHLLHVLIGIAVLTFLLHRSRVSRPLGPRDIAVLENGASYWRLVDLLWVVLFALLYLMA